MSATMTVGKSSVHALGNVWSGVKISTKMGAGDLRDTTSDVVSYKYVKQKSHVLTIMCISDMEKIMAKLLNNHLIWRLMQRLVASTPSSLCH